MNQNFTHLLPVLMRNSMKKKRGYFYSPVGNYLCRRGSSFLCTLGGLQFSSKFSKILRGCSRKMTVQFNRNRILGFSLFWPCWAEIQNFNPIELWGHLLATTPPKYIAIYLLAYKNFIFHFSFIPFFCFHTQNYRVRALLKYTLKLMTRKSSHSMHYFQAQQSRSLSPTFGISFLNRIYNMQFH